MKNSINSILIRRSNAICIPTGEPNTLPKEVAAAFNRNLEGLGYTLSQNALVALSTCTVEQVAKLMDEVLPILQALRGVKKYEPMYPNFPTQVMEASDAELYINATIHYLTVWISDVTGERQEWLPKYAKDKRESLRDVVKLTPLRFETEHSVTRIVTDIIQSNTSISETDKADIVFAYENGLMELPSSIPQKETMAFVAALLLKNNDWVKITPLVKTATDVLRIAVAMSGGDVSLAENTKFRNFTRAERRGLISLLENCSGNSHQLTEDMFRHPKRWIRLGEKLHPFEFDKDKYRHVHSAFDIIRNNKDFATWAGRLERNIQTAEFDAATQQLVERPGEFARRLDHLLRLSPSTLTVERFASVAHRVSTPVLLQTMAHFKGRQDPKDLRVFFPKGNMAKVQAIPTMVLDIPEETCAQVVTTCEGALVNRFKKLPPLGRTFVDNRMSGYLVPFSQRSASKSLRTLVRGSRIPFGTDADTIRFFLWWKDLPNGGRVDVDLSALMYGPNWEFKEYIAYTNLRSSKYKAAHSGDITSAPRGACEFIDVDIPSVLKYGGRYVIMSVNSFTGQKFSDIPEASAGWMLRQEPKSGEVFEPKTVADRIDLTIEAQAAMPIILDLQERMVIWVDAAMKRNRGYVNNVHGNSDQIVLLGKAFTQIAKPNLYDLFRLHAMARGEMVTEAENAETVFAPDRGVTPFQLEVIASQYMQD